MVINKLLELNEILIHLFVSVSLKINSILTEYLCTIGPNVLCCKERSPQKKKYSNSKVREENIAVVFIQL